MQVIAVAKRKTIAEQAQPALLAVAIVALGIVFIPTHYPVKVHNGTITPGYARAGDKIEVSWTQDWRHLCPVTVTREFVGMDGYKKTSIKLDFEAPKTTGLHDFRSNMVLPDLPVGPAFYRSTIEPHCWVDALWQRAYHTPDVPVTVLPPSPAPGPR